VISRHTLKLAHTHSLNVTGDMLIDLTELIINPDD